MYDFDVIKFAVDKQFKKMQAHDLFRVQVEKDLLWETYLKSFPKGTNPIYKERTEHDCQCCKQFIRAVGGVVAIIDGKLESIWDINIEGFYQDVANGMSKLVKSCPIENVFLHTEPTAGTDKNFQDKDGKVITWTHFYTKLPAKYVVKGTDIGTLLGESRSSKDVMFRGLKELTTDAVDTVLDLIGQSSLYRGDEHKFAVQSFQKLQKAFNKLKTDAEKDIFCWSQLKTVPASVARIRNTSIGTLLVDISNGVELDQAVASFERMVAPTNYKRPTAVVTKAMIAKAQKTIDELGLAPALERRYATIEDITVNNILFVDRAAKKKLKGNVFDDLASTVPEKAKNFEKVEEVHIDDFIKNILPKSTSVEILVENRHTKNLVSLVAPVDNSAKPLFKWPNNFSWSYTGDLADSIKERVKKAGGKVDGDLRCSLSWFNHDDLDLHMVEPNGYEIYYANRGYPSANKGVLDVDMNAGCGTTRTPVENICYLDRKYMKEGLYVLKVHNFAKRESVDLGFEVEIEFDGNITTISHPAAVRDRAMIDVATIRYSKAKGFEIVSSLPAAQASKTIWGIDTQKFHKASVVMLSPNHWDEKAVGNKHYFFMLDGCTNDDKARGFFNEFLSEDLTPHRKVLELVGSKMKTEESANQLSGLGFSSTQRNSVLCKVNGNFTRTVKVLF